MGVALLCFVLNTATAIMVCEMLRRLFVFPAKCAASRKPHACGRMRPAFASHATPITIAIIITINAIAATAVAVAIAIAINTMITFTTTSRNTIAIAIAISIGTISAIGQ